ncbi:transcriptional regulator with XRE-family HTH domain [Actinoplanes lutulentus]|uniref:XRE family transcriptional regulator n=2 Tax=Actinoplanes lutulentus TaxID=1287878 RepID=A0A327ZG75_9ACTN|nr:transcriptional regulator with XRE-family HTH domain [Actinoplanes lutulentus]RAK39658.1 XRE family transcriptional regulator [Actinoplanes lutulentus]
MNEREAFVKPNNPSDGANMQQPAPPLAVIAAALRRERDRAGITLTELARRAGLAKSTLSQLEAGTGNPSIETLWALGVALDVPFSRLVEPPTSPVRIIRAGEGPRLRSDHADFVATLLATGSPQTRRDIYMMELEPGEPREAAAHIPGSVEHIVVSKGRIRTGPVDEPVELGPGDYVTFPGDVPHRYEALEPSWAVLIMEHR